MKAKRDSNLPTYRRLRGVLENKPGLRFFGIIASLGCTFALAAFLLTGLARSASLRQPNQTPPEGQSSPAAKSHGSVDLSGKSPDELASYVFESHGCKSCHTQGQGGKLGFTDRGKDVGKNFEGCISLLTSMNVIAQTKTANRTAEEKTKAARFQQFGCTTCHQIVPGKLGLTEYGKKLKSLHMACTDVEKILAK
jgi:cytochrome c551/c552